MSNNTPGAGPDDRTAPAPAPRRSLPWAESLICLAIFALAMIPRAAWVAYNDRNPQGLNDPTLYTLFGDRIADGDGYTRPDCDPAVEPLHSCGAKIAYYPAGFPITVGALKKGGDIFGWGRSIFSIKIMNGIFGAMTVVLLYLLTRRIFDRRTGIVAALLLSIFPSQVYYTGTVLSEPLFTLLFVASILALLWKPWDREGIGYGRLFAVGLLLSYATMTRGITLMLPALLLVVWFFYMRSKKRALLQALVVWAGIAVLIVPWSVRNSIAFHTVVGPSTNMGDDLCIGNYVGAQGAFTLQGECFAHDEGKTASQVEIDRNRDGVKIAVKAVLTHPFRMPKLIAQKAYWLLYKDDDGIWAAESYGNDYFIPHFRREVLAFAANSIYYATGVMVLVGGLAFVLAKDVRRLIVMLMMLYVLALPLVFFGDPRFHFPAIPLAVVIASATILALWDAARAQRGAGQGEPS